MVTIGYIYAEYKLTSEDKLFLKLAREGGAKVVVFPATQFISPEKIKNLAKKCNIVLNGSAEQESVEIAKMIEEAGTQVVDPSRSLYYHEDKMMFYVHCRKKHILTPKTYLLPIFINQCREPIKRLIKKNGAVVIKNILSDNGQFVDRAKTVKQAIALVKKFRKRDRAPLIAQEYIKAAHKVYRVTVLDGKVVQSVIKKSKNWKCTGRFVKGDAPVFRVTPKLEKICVKIAKILKIPWCGIDLMRRGREWVAIEANTCPGMDFVARDVEGLYGQLIKYLISAARD